MGRKKSNDMADENGESHGPTINDFVARQKVSAFASAYEPASEQTFTTEVFNEIRLREYFKADVCTLGDPLVVYLDLLEGLGFNMTTSIQGEPVILVNEKY